MRFYYLTLMHLFTAVNMVFVIDALGQVEKLAYVEDHCAMELQICRDDEICSACQLSWDFLEPSNISQVSICNSDTIRSIYDGVLEANCIVNSAVSDMLHCVSKAVDLLTCSQITCIDYFNTCAFDESCAGCISLPDASSGIGFTVKSCEDLVTLTSLIGMPSTCDLNSKPLFSLLMCLGGNVSPALDCTDGFNLNVNNEGTEVAPEKYDCLSVEEQCKNDLECKACISKWDSLQPTNPSTYIVCNADAIRSLYADAIDDLCSQNLLVGAMLDCSSATVDARVCQSILCIDQFNECALDSACLNCLSVTDATPALGKRVSSCGDVPTLMNIIGMPSTCNLESEPLNSLLNCLVGNGLSSLDCSEGFGSVTPGPGPELSQSGAMAIFTPNFLALLVGFAIVLL